MWAAAKKSLAAAGRAVRFRVHGIDPVRRHVEILSELATAQPERLSFGLGRAESLPVDSESVDLVWCRDVLVHVADLDAAYAEFRRVLRPQGHAVMYQMFGTDRLEPREADWLYTTMGIVPTSANATRTEQAIAAAGLRGAEWGEYNEEHDGKPSRKLLHAARLLRDPERYTARYGHTAHDIMLGDCLWHIYRMIGKLSPRVYLLST